MPSRSSFPRLLRALHVVLLVVACAAASAQTTPPAYVFSSPLLPLILQAPENGWVHVNINRFQDVWTPDDLEPWQGALDRSPAHIIEAWSGFGWDSNRGDLILYGGGHANYGGNDVYRWRSSTMRWERASLPSDIYFDPVSGYQAIDGVDHAPSAAHTYDNNGFLPIADRFITFGGAAYNNGGPYLRVLETNPQATRTVGPYLFDPNKADGNKVGGTTGSHVQRVSPHPEVVGGNMWENRDWPKNLAGQSMPGLHREGCTGFTIENGKDVVYVAASNQFSTQLDLYRYQVTDVTQPTLDVITKVGLFSVGVGGDVTCGWDPARKLFVRTGSNAVPFQFWDVTTPSPTNPDKNVQVDTTIAGLQSWFTSQNFNIHNCALEFDPTRRNFPLWCGGGTVWTLQEPPTNTTSGWTVTQLPAPTTATPSTADQAISVLGKWRYASYYDVFVTLENPIAGDVWIYKPVGWSQPNPPGNALPTVNLLSPTGGSTVVPGATVTLTANAADSDGSIARVEYYVNGQKMGQATTPPYTVNIAPVLVGSYTVSAIAVDNVGGMGLSQPVTFSVNATLTSTTLQRGLNGYAGAFDTFLDNTQRTSPRGNFDPLYLDLFNYTPLVRFAIFASEGGPVPDGAVLQSATLSLYKQYYSDALQLNALLLPWTEADATWNNRQIGVPWTAGGASAAGSDYATPADVVLSAPSYTPGWVSFDVTARAQQWSNSGGNYGWRLSQAGPGGNAKNFSSSEYAANTTLRPKLTLVWSGGGSVNQPPTVSITSPSSPTTITLGGSVTLTANAQDADGVTQVVYTGNGVPITSPFTVSPYLLNWTPVAAGTYTVVATATDTKGATGSSAPVTIIVQPVATGTTVVLQRGVSGYAGVTDTFLDATLPSTVRGSFDPLYVDATKYMPLLRFSIFQSEGGPVPNGATIQSAIIGLYKGSYSDTLRLNALLRPWTESQATWQVAQTGASWSVAGAAGAGTDYNASADALVAAPFSAGWVNFDVTSRVQQWSGGPSSNFGWRLSQTTSGYNPKTFNSSETTANTTLRPKLTVIYSGGNMPPTVSIATPASGASVTLGGSFSLTANAADGDGSVTSVQYFANGTSIGTSTVAANGFALTWTPAVAGNYTLTAVATDNASATTTSVGVPVVVNPVSGTTVVLQRGLSGYAGVTDTFLDSQLQTTVRGSFDPLYLDVTKYLPLVRFAIFQSEGGPVPNNATILSATLALNKGPYNDTIRVNALLKPWVETQATWLLSQTGVPWSTPGAGGVGTDYASAADALVAAPFASGWVTFDVSSRVQQWSLGQGTPNYGWRLSQTTSGINPKTFNSSETTANTTLRPKLTVTYQ